MILVIDDVVGPVLSISGPGGLKDCYRNLNMKECREFLKSFWSLCKAEQDSFET